MAPAEATAEPVPADGLHSIQALKRRRTEQQKKDPYDVSDDEYVPYKVRRLQQLQRVSARVGKTGGNDSSSPAVAPGTPTTDKDADVDAAESDSTGVPYRSNRTLLDEARELREKEKYESKTEAERIAEEDRKILEAHLAKNKRLAGVNELAQGIAYVEPIKTSWQPPAFVTNIPEEEMESLRKENHIITEGEDIPPCINNFRDMRIPDPLLRYLLEEKKIKKPTPIQMQGLPTAFSGRDMIGIAFTGSGKTLAFTLPIVLFATEDELRLPYERGEGPTGLIVCPSRELARQTYENTKAMCEVLERAGYPLIHVVLAIGGINMADQQHVLSRGFHIVVATPGRLQDMLQRKKFNLTSCKYLCMDEADRMIDMGFEEDVRNIMSFFKHQRQTLLFSATMPKKIRDFAEQSLIKPVVVNVGRAGAASMAIDQVIEEVAPEAKMPMLVQTIYKTAPPTIVFSDSKNEVDDIQEYLLLRGISAVAIHGSKTQDEREYAIRSFKTGQKDVMVASGVASKGLDFNDIQHVINYTMPQEIEDYVHQIGRTGRSGNRGTATTFVNRNTPDQTLLDLKYLLIEARQPVPSFLNEIEDPRAALAGGNAGQVQGCAFCGGLGHSIRDCPKLEGTQRRQTAAFSRGDGGGF